MKRKIIWLSESDSEIRSLCAIAHITLSGSHHHGMEVLAFTDYGCFAQ